MGFHTYKKLKKHFFHIMTSLATPSFKIQSLLNFFVLAVTSCTDDLDFESVILFSQDNMHREYRSANLEINQLVSIQDILADRRGPQFLCPRKRSFGVNSFCCVCPLVCLAVFLFVLKYLTLPITFDLMLPRLSHFTCVFLVMSPFSGYHQFDLLTLTLEFDRLLRKNFKTFTLAISFEQWISGHLFFTYVFFVKDLSLDTNNLNPLTLTLQISVL